MWWEDLKRERLLLCSRLALERNHGTTLPFSHCWSQVHPGKEPHVWNWAIPKTWKQGTITSQESGNTLPQREAASRGSYEGMSIRCNLLKNLGSRGHHVGSFLVSDPIFFRKSGHSLWFLWRLTIPWGNKISGLKEKVKKELYHEADEKIFLRNIRWESFEISLKDQIFELWT